MKILAAEKEQLIDILCNGWYLLLKEYPKWGYLSFDSDNDVIEVCEKTNHKHGYRMVDVFQLSDEDGDYLEELLGDNKLS